MTTKQAPTPVQFYRFTWKQFRERVNSTVGWGCWEARWAKALWRAQRKRKCSAADLAHLMLDGSISGIDVIHAGKIMSCMLRRAELAKLAGLRRRASKFVSVYHYRAMCRVQRDQYAFARAVLRLGK